jgi:ribonuclease HII
MRSGDIEVALDEVAKGTLAGPVVAAAVVWPSLESIRAKNDPEYAILLPLVQDSKKLSLAQRERARDFIKKHAVAWAIAEVSAEVIDRINILKASWKAMHLCLDQIVETHGVFMDNILVDGDRFIPYMRPEARGVPSSFVPHQCVIEGDGKYVSIAAASILAKTYRDDLMRTHVHARYPQYGFDKHVGYGTAQHIRAIAEHGPCPEHRRSFSWGRDMPRQGRE